VSESDLFIGDAERTAAASELRRHYDAGRLRLPEFEDRLALVHAARTESDLRSAFDRLPTKHAPTPSPTLRPRDTRWRSLAVQYLLVNVIAVLIWLFSGAHGDFWPRWVFVVTLIMFVRRVFGRRSGGRHRALPPSQLPREP
jgi:hypothetical protein